MVQVIQGIRDFESSFIRATKGIAPSCMLYAKLLLHGVYEDLAKLQSKKTALEQANLCFDQTNPEEECLESKVHGWLTR